MKLTKLLMAIAIVTTVSFVSCKPKDTDVQTAIETKLKAKPDMGTVTVDVKDGIATINGVCKDEVCKADCEKIAADEKGVKSVVNNLTIASVVPTTPTTTAPVSIAADEPLKKSVTDATKDYPTVNAAVNNGVITLTGEIKKASLPKLMMALNGLNPKKVENKLTVK